MIIIKYFNERIYQLRKELGFTQEEIAAKLNVSRQTISNWENGTAQPTIDKAIELASLYGASMDELVGNFKKKKKESSKLLLPLMKQSITLYIDPETDAWPAFKRRKIKKCKVIEVNPTSIRIIMHEKRHTIEKIILLKDILGFERMVD